MTLSEILRIGNGPAGIRAAFITLGLLVGHRLANLRTGLPHVKPRARVAQDNVNGVPAA